VLCGEDGEGGEDWLEQGVGADTHETEETWCYAEEVGFRGNGCEHPCQGDDDLGQCTFASKGTAGERE
jgi:hypothetical protein